MLKKSTAKVFISLIAFSLILSYPTTFAESSTNKNTQSATENTSYVTLKKYDSYLKENSSLQYLSEPVSLKSENMTSSSDNVKIGSAYGKDNVILFSENTGNAEFSFNLPENGLYNMQITYVNLPLKMTNIEFALSINGVVPFSEAENLSLPRQYQNSEIKTDSRGNDIRSSKHEVFSYRTVNVTDSSYIYKALAFQFNQGENKIKIESIRGGYAIESILLTSVKDAISYGTYLKDKKENQDKTASDYLLKIQGENADIVSDTVLYPTYDKMNAATEVSDGGKNSPSKLKLNTIGQSTFNKAGQYITWNFSVPEDGFYNIGLHARQNEIRGFYSSRNIYIDGKIPFKELQNVHFDYTYNWNIYLIGEKNPYQIYLSAGQHTITLEVSAGDAAEVLNSFDNIIFDLNTLYREIIMITGVSPDQYRDYSLNLQIPQFNERLTELANRLETLRAKMQELGIMRGNNAVAAQTLIIQLEDFVKKPRSVPLRITNFNDNISSLSGWVLSIKSQPLEIDYLFVKGIEAENPVKGASFTEQFAFRVKSFVSSFYEDYSLISDTNSEQESIDVWVGTGRDQAQIIKDQVDNTFTPETGIHANISLVQQGLVEAVAAGRGPDVMLYTDNITPINLAARGALTDLSTFTDFGKVKSRFSDELFVQYEYEGGTYALPLEQNYYMLFYRKDIFADYNLNAPKTWEDFYYVLGRLQKNNLSAGIPVGSAIAPDNTVFMALLFQNGGTLYNQDLSATNLNNDAALKSFKQWTEFYTKYGLSVEFNFFTRFRSGEMPIGLQSYTFYNQLTIAAPEIAGLWEMTAIPGVSKEDGTVDNMAVSSCNSAVILSTCQDKDAAFHFLEWFTRGDVQTDYGLTVENILGAGGRYAPANKEALENMNWTQKELDNIKKQGQNTKVVPIIPATYMVTRNLTNAFRKVVISRENHRETLYKYSLAMNVEITKKRDELTIN